MKSLSGRVGVAPGTTTLTLGGQDPGVTVHDPYGNIMGAGLGVVRPTDFEMSSLYEYMPVNQGWIVGVPVTTPARDLGFGWSAPSWVVPAAIGAALTAAAFLLLGR